MRWIRWILSSCAVALFCSVANAADATAPQPDCACRTAKSCGPACCTKRCASPGLPLTPGCCEHGNNSCNNAWEGYCRDKAPWEALWCKLGTGAFYPSTPCATHKCQGVALEVEVRPGAAACGCQPMHRP